MQTNEIYVIFFTYVSTTKSIWFHAFELSQQKVRHYVTIHYTVSCLACFLLPGNRIGETPMLYKIFFGSSPLVM